MNYIKRLLANSEPLARLKRIEDPIVRRYYSLLEAYPFTSQTPITKYLVNTSLLIFGLWQVLPYTYMFRHFQISEYTLSRGYLHTILTGSLSHRDLVHLAPNLVVYYVLGRFLESRHGSRKLFYLYMMSSVAGTLAVYLFEKLLAPKDSVNLVVPKCNGSVVAGGLIGAALVKYPFAYFNPLGLKHTMTNGMFMIPLGVIVVFYSMIEYYSWKQGYVEYISREANTAGFITGMLYGLKYLK